MERLSKEAETIHDEAMKTMAEMNRLKRQFKKLLTEMPQNAPDRKPYMDAVAQMEKAENGMMDWMTNYREPAPNTMPEQAIRYLREQKSKIEQNRKDIDDALAAGQKLLKK